MKTKTLRSGQSLVFFVFSKTFFYQVTGYWPSPSAGPPRQERGPPTMSSCTYGSGVCSGHRACCTAGSLSAGTPLLWTSCWCWWRRPTPPSPSLGARGAGGAARHHTRQEEVGGALAAPQQRLLASLAGGRQAREGAPVSVCSTLCEPG